MTSNTSEEVLSFSPANPQIGLDSQTVFGMSPLDHVMLAFNTGFSFVSLAHGPPPWRLEQFAPWSLRDDPQLIRQLKNLLQETKIGVQLAEGFVIRPNANMIEREVDLDLYAEIGAHKVAVVSMEPDPSRALDQLHSLTNLAHQRGLDVVFEYAPSHTFNTLKTASAAVMETGAANISLLIDAMHFFRCGGTVDDLKDLQVPVAYLQLSDAPLTGTTQNYYDEACFQRLAPGTGALDLIGLLTSIHHDVPIGLEVPMLNAIKNGTTFEDLSRDILNRTKELISMSRNNI